MLVKINTYSSLHTHTIVHHTIVSSHRKSDGSSREVSAGSTTSAVVTAEEMDANENSKLSLLYMPYSTTVLSVSNIIIDSMVATYFALILLLLHFPNRILYSRCRSRLFDGHYMFVFVNIHIHIYMYVYIYMPHNLEAFDNCNCKVS